MGSTQLHALDIAERAVKTFLQGFLVMWAASNYSLTKVALIAAGMAGLSAVWNITTKVQNYLNAPTPPQA